MKTRRLILCGTGIVLGLACVYWTLTWKERDPVYNGKPLSQHMESFRINGLSFSSFRNPTSETSFGPRVNIASMGTAGEAVLAVGTNAFPMLVRMLGDKEKRRDRWIRVLVTRYGWLQGLMPKNGRDRWVNRTRAAAAFQILGPRGAPAADRIVPLLNHPDTALPAIVALMSIQPQLEEHILSLTNVARVQARSNTSPDLLLMSAVLALGSFGPKAAGATPFLMDSLSSTNIRVQAAAAVALAQVGAPAEKVVPLVVKTLPKTVPTPAPGLRPGPGLFAVMRTRGETVAALEMQLWALEQYGPKAREALPSLAILEQSRTSNTRTAATRASEKIRAKPEPEASPLRD